MHFGSTLRLLRGEAGISLRELASRIGVSGAYLSRVENGHDAAPTPDRLLAIADALGLPGPVLVELARQAGPAVDSYLQRNPEAGALFLEIAQRKLAGVQIARIKAFIDEEFPSAARSHARRLIDLVTVAQVIVGVSCADLEDLVSIAASRLPASIDARAVVARLRAQPTSLGGGFAILHAEVDTPADAAVLLTLAEPLAVETPDQRPVRVVFLLVRGADSRTRLEVVARVARLASYDITDELCAASTPEQVHAIIERVESLW